MWTRQNGMSRRWFLWHIFDVFFRIFNFWQFLQGDHIAFRGIKFFVCFSKYFLHQKPHSYVINNFYDCLVIPIISVQPKINFVKNAFFVINYWLNKVQQKMAVCCQKFCQKLCWKLWQKFCQKDCQKFC